MINYCFAQGLLVIVVTRIQTKLQQLERRFRIVVCVVIWLRRNSTQLRGDNRTQQKVSKDRSCEKNRIPEQNKWHNQTFALAWWDNYLQKWDSNLNDNNCSCEQSSDKTFVTAIRAIGCANKPQVASYCLAVLQLTWPRARQAPPQNQKQRHTFISFFPVTDAFDRFCFRFRKTHWFKYAAQVPRKADFTDSE